MVLGAVAVARVSCPEPALGAGSDAGIFPAIGNQTLASKEASYNYTARQEKDTAWQKPSTAASVLYSNPEHLP